MATTIPEALKPADITRFAIRAAQIEKAKPEIAYWCEYIYGTDRSMMLNENRLLLDRATDSHERSS